MNWKSTVALIILVAAAGVWLWKGDEWAPSTAPNAAPPDPSALTALEGDFAAGTITRIEIAPAGGDAFAFDRTEKGWKQPGDWPLRTVEVNELVETLGTLRTRFQPVRPDENLFAEWVEFWIDTFRSESKPVAPPQVADAKISLRSLRAFGLTDAQKPLTVKVSVGEKKYELKIGEPDLKPGESPFTRPA